MKFTHPTIKISDSPEQVFNLEPYDADCWIDFQTINLQEIEVPPTPMDVISILYNNEILNGSALYFTQCYNLTSLLYNIWDAGLVFDTEHVLGIDGLNTTFMTNFRPNLT